MSPSSSIEDSARDNPLFSAPNYDWQEGLTLMRRGKKATIRCDLWSTRQTEARPARVPLRRPLVCRQEKMAHVGEEVTRGMMKMLCERAANDLFGPL